MVKAVFPKPFWSKAIGASLKPRRLNLKANKSGHFECPVKFCESEIYHSIRGCRKHVYNRHGWYYFFDDKPILNEVFPVISTTKNTYNRPKKSNTSSMPSFLKNCGLASNFNAWLKSPGGGGKSHSQAEQLSSKILKYMKFCCQDVSPCWEVPISVIDYCIGSVKLMAEFVTSLQDEWKVGYSGMIGYMNSLSHFLDYRRSMGLKPENISVLIASEIYLDRVKKFLSKKMRIEWNSVLSIEHLTSINCWATLEDLQQVIPYHADKFTHILLNSSTSESFIPSQELSFATAYIVAILFLLVKATRPMTYQYLTVSMMKRIGNDGIVDQTIFKTREKYGFDSLVFSKEVIDIINGYITCIRPRLNPTCEYLLISRNGTQLKKLTDVFGRIVFQAIGKYINPTRYRQIVETESAMRLDPSQQDTVSADQKHTSQVAKVHYRKQQSQLVAQKAKDCMELLRSTKITNETLSAINDKVVKTKNLQIDFAKQNNPVTGPFNFDKTSNEQTGGAKPGLSRQKKCTFSAIEDSFLLAAIKEHGAGRWTAILNDEKYTFHSSRKSSTLFTRAKSKGWI